MAFETAKAVKRMAVKDVADLEQRAQQSRKRSAEARSNLELLEKHEYHINKRQRKTLQVGQVDKRKTHLLCVNGLQRLPGCYTWDTNPGVEPGSTEKDAVHRQAPNFVNIWWLSLPARI